MSTSSFKTNAKTFKLKSSIELKVSKPTAKLNDMPMYYVEQRAGRGGGEKE